METGDGGYIEEGYEFTWDRNDPRSKWKEAQPQIVNPLFKKWGSWTHPRESKVGGRGALLSQPEALLIH